MQTYEVVLWPPHMYVPWHVCTYIHAHGHAHTHDVVWHKSWRKVNIVTHKDTTEVQFNEPLSLLEFLIEVWTRDIDDSSGMLEPWSSLQTCKQLNSFTVACLVQSRSPQQSLLFYSTGWTDLVHISGQFQGLSEWFRTCWVLCSWRNDCDTMNSTSGQMNPSMPWRVGQFLLAIDSCLEIVCFEGMALACHSHITQQYILDWSWWILKLGRLKVEWVWNKGWVWEEFLEEGKYGQNRLYEIFK